VKGQRGKGVPRPHAALQWKRSFQNFSPPPQALKKVTEKCTNRAAIWMAQQETQRTTANTVITHSLW